MGLDVVHLKLTLTPDNPRDFIFEDKWAQYCNVPLEHYSRFVMDAKHWEWLDECYIVDNKQHYLQLQDVRDFVGDKVFFRDADSWQQKLDRFVANRRLHGADRESELIKQNGVVYEHISFTKTTLVMGLHYIEVAEQRKGMNNDFYDYFRSGPYEFWGRKEDFEFAATCVANDDHYREIWRAEDIAWLQAAFQRDFVDSFVFGESLLWPSF